jgi:hypothetical protein
MTTAAEAELGPWTARRLPEPRAAGSIDRRPPPEGAAGA